MTLQWAVMEVTIRLRSVAGVGAVAPSSRQLLFVAVLETTVAPSSRRRRLSVAEAGATAAVVATSSLRLHLFVAEAPVPWHLLSVVEAVGTR